MRLKRNQSSPPPSGAIRDLLGQLQADATDSSRPIADVLRMCVRLGSALQSNEIAEWARAELNGYEQPSEIPSYRTLRVAVQADFNGPWGSGVKNAQLPIWLFEKDEVEDTFNTKLAQPAAALAELAAGGEDIRLFFPAHTVAILQSRPQVYEDMAIASAWQTISNHAMHGVVDTVRTKALELSLAVEASLPPPDDEGLQPLPSAGTMHQVFHTVVEQGANAVVGGSVQGVSQVAVTVSPGDFDSLRRLLADMGLPAETIEDLRTAIKNDQDSPDQPGPATQSWIGRTMSQIGLGTLSVSSDTAGSLIAEAVLRFLGLSS